MGQSSLFINLGRGGPRLTSEGFSLLLGTGRSLSHGLLGILGRKSKLRGALDSHHQPGTEVQGSHLLPEGKIAKALNQKVGSLGMAFGAY
jgi:hypothetical protein